MAFFELELRRVTVISDMRVRMRAGSVMSCVVSHCDVLGEQEWDSMYACASARL
jgi:hypothetical protein